MAVLTESDVRTALSKVIDPEIRKPITDLGMVKSIDISDDGAVGVGIYLTTSGCPMKTEISDRVKNAVADVAGVGTVSVELDVMNDEQRTELRKSLRGDSAEPIIPFAQPGSLTRVYAVASGKGGVGKSTVTANLAVALADQRLSVGLVDADVHGFSIPGLLGIPAGTQPTRIDDLMLPPVAHGVKTISIGMFLRDGESVVAWRGPMLHRTVSQFLTDVFFGDLDVLLIDMPPGTGDIAISIGQLLPHAEVLVVTTPQTAAAEVAIRSGLVARQTGQRVIGVIENMAAYTLPDGTLIDLFGSGGGAAVAEALSEPGATVPLLASIPLSPALRQGGDAGEPIVGGGTTDAAAATIRDLAATLARQGRGLSGRSLPMSIG